MLHEATFTIKQIERLAFHAKRIAPNFSRKRGQTIEKKEVEVFIGMLAEAGVAKMLNVESWWAKRQIEIWKSGIFDDGGFDFTINGVRIDVKAILPNCVLVLANKIRADQYWAVAVDVKKRTVRLIGIATSDMMIFGGDDAIPKHLQKTCKKKYVCHVDRLKAYEKIHADVGAGDSMSDGIR